MILLQIYHWVWYWKNFENRLTFGEVMGKSLVSCFLLTHGVVQHWGLAFSALTLLVGRKEGHLASKKNKWWGAGMVIYLKRGADVHTTQLMPLPLTVSCFREIQTGFTFYLLPAHPCSRGKRPIKHVWLCVHVFSAGKANALGPICTVHGQKQVAIRTNKHTHK